MNSRLRQAYIPGTGPQGDLHQLVEIIAEIAGFACIPTVGCLAV